MLLSQAKRSGISPMEGQISIGNWTAGESGPSQGPDYYSTAKRLSLFEILCVKLWVRFPSKNKNDVDLGLGVKHLNCRYPIYTSCSRYKMNTNNTLHDPEERYDTSQSSYTITFRLQSLSELTVGMLSYKI